MHPILIYIKPLALLIQFFQYRVSRKLYVIKVFRLFAISWIPISKREFIWRGVTRYLFIMPIEWENYDVRTQKNNLPHVPSRFSYGALHWGFSIYELNKAWVKHKLTILLHFVLQCKLHTSIPKTKKLKQLCSFFKTYVLNNWLDKNVWAVNVCSLHCRTNSKSIVKLCLPQALIY